MIAGGNLEPGAAELAELPEQRVQAQFVEPVAPRMRDDGDTARIADHVDRLVQRRPRVRDEARLPLDQVTAETSLMSRQWPVSTR